MVNERYQQQSIPDLFARRATQLAIKLQKHITSSGPIPVSNYVQACLKDPEHGYYIHNPAIGAAGDFVTAPEISQIFGELIGIWCVIVWRHMGEPEQLNLLELGPGRGTLMSDMLRVIAKLPKLKDGLDIHLLETNQTLRQQQKQTLQKKTEHFTHYNNAALLHDAARQTGAPWIVVGNEFLDALGVRQLVTRNGVWHERTVQLNSDGQLCFGIGESLETYDAGWPDAEKAPDGEIFEIIPEIDATIIPLLRALIHHSPVASLFIDYGYEQTRCGETLQAVRRHAYEHPLTSPGEADLTVHVDFSRIAAAFQKANMTPHTVMTQAEFLGRLGIVERTSQLMSANPDRASDLETATLRLIAPNGMGGLFKTIAASSPHLSPLPIFGAAGI